MALSIALNFEDGVTRFIECRPGETVADASYRVGINIPLDCRDGACGTCKCRVQSGDFTPGDYIEDALTDEEAAEGLALACQAKPKTDMVVDIFASSEVCKTKGQMFQVQIKSVDRLSPTSPLVHAWKGRGRSTSWPASTSTCWCPARISGAPIRSARRRVRRRSPSWCGISSPG